MSQIVARVLLLLQFFLVSYPLESLACRDCMDNPDDLASTRTDEFGLVYKSKATKPGCAEGSKDCASNKLRESPKQVSHASQKIKKSNSK